MARKRRRPAAAKKPTVMRSGAKNQPSRMVRLNVPEDVWRRFRARAAEEGVPAGWLLGYMVEEYVATHPRKEP